MIYGRSIALFLLVASTVSAGSAGASAVCDNLRERLNADPVVVGNGNELMRYSSALTRQNFEIRKARQNLQRMNCGAGSVIFLSQQGGNGCNEMVGALKRMEDNRQILTAKIENLRSGGTSATRNSIRAALEANGCDGEPQKPEIVAIRPLEGPQLPRALARQLMLNEMQGPSFATIEPRPQAGFALTRPNGALMQPSGGLRTLCVRTCDGAFFPISSNTGPGAFQRDERICQQMCPGTDARLYYHALQGQESTDMVSVATGEPYRNLTNAFAYLNRSPGERPACGCNLAEYYRRAQQEAKGTPIGESGYASITEIRGTMPQDAPATGRKVEDLPPPPERSYDPKSQNVRQVGPVFLPAQTSSIDLRHPAGETYQPLQ